MTEEKMRILGKLYALRAGLSAIFGFCEEKKYLMEYIEKNNIDISNLESKQNKCDEEIKKFEAENKTLKFTEIDRTFIDLEEEEKKKRKNKRNMMLKVIGIGLVVIGIIMLFFCLISLNQGRFSALPLKNGISVSWIFIIGGAILALLFKSNISTKANDNTEYGINDTVNIEKINIYGKPEFYKERDNIVAQLESMKEKREKLLWEVKKAEQKICLEGYPIYSALQKFTQKILFEGDWKLLDFVIYSIESGRENTVRESLKTADFLKGQGGMASIKMVVENFSEIIKNINTEGKAETEKELNKICNIIDYNETSFLEKQLIKAGLRSDSENFEKASVGHLQQELEKEAKVPAEELIAALESMLEQRNQLLQEVQGINDQDSINIKY